MLSVTWLALDEQSGVELRSTLIVKGRQEQLGLLTLQVALLELDSAAHKYQVAGDPRSLDQLNAARTRALARLGDVCPSPSEERILFDRCATLKSMVNEALRGVEDKIDIRRSREAAVALSPSQETTPESMRRLSEELNRLGLSAQRAVESRRTINRQNSSAIRRAIIGGVSLSALLVAFSFLMLVRENRARLRAEISLRRTMESTRSENERHRILVEGITDYAIYMLDARGFITSWNPGAQRLKGYREEEIVGKHFSTFYTPPDLASRKPERELEIAAASGRYEEEGWRSRKDRSRFWASVVITRLCDESGKVRGFAKITRDVTARKLAEEELALERRKLKAAFEHADMGLILSDSHGKIVSLNATAMRCPAMATMAEFSAPTEQLEREWEIADHGEVISVDDWPLQRAVRGSYCRDRYIHVRNRGTNRSWVLSLTSVAAYTEAGDRDMIVMSLLDITERVAAEREVKELTVLLEQRVSERTAQLETANRELESFSYSVSHDLRAPLRHVQGYIRMLLRECSGAELNEKAQRYLETIRAASCEMGQLIDGLLAFSRTNYLEISESFVDLNRLVHDTISSTEGSTQGREIDWRVDKLPTVAGDPVALRQIYSNLIENAVKYTGTRPIARIEVGLAGEEGNRVILVVRDNGVGFDMQFAGKLFGLFERLHRDPRFEGTGTGLAIVQRLVARQGGRVWAESSPDHGAAFFFTMARGPSSEGIQEGIDELPTAHSARRG